MYTNLWYKYQNMRKIREMIKKNKYMLKKQSTREGPQRNQQSTLTPKVSWNEGYRSNL